MSKYIKRYNKDTRQWELVSAPDVSIIHEMRDGEKITDTDVIVTNYNYSESGETSSLSDTLSIISDDISRLQRNVSWLGMHGGGGGGGGTGSTTGYGIEIISPIIENNAVYISTKSFSVQFKITGGTTSEEYQYRYIFDGTEVSEYKRAENEQEVTITVKDINSVTDSAAHQFQLEVITQIGITLRSSFRIYENSLSLALNTTKNNISNGEVIVTMNGNGIVWFNVKNGILSSNTTLHYECNGAEFNHQYVNTSTSTQEIPINIWEVIDKSSVQANDLHIVEIYAQATYGTTINNKTDTMVFGIRIRNTEEMVIYFDGLAYEEDVEQGLSEPTDVELNGRLKFNFRVYLPTLVTDQIIYYAVKVVSPGGDEYFAAGETFNDNEYNRNVLDAAQKYISMQIPLASYYVSPGWRVIVKVWSSSDKNLNTTKVGAFTITETNSDVFPRQHAKRFTGIGPASADTCIFAWDSTSLMKDDTWTSSIRHYMPAYGSSGESVEISTIAYLKTYNTNGRSSGFITSESVPYMRLQNEAYAIASMDDYRTEIGFMTNNSNDYGFDISITFKADDLADDTKTVFLWGTNDVGGNLSNGIKISVSKAEWYIHGTDGMTKRLSAHLRPAKKNTVDFLYDRQKVYIIVDGVVCAVDTIGNLDPSAQYQFGTKAYFATNFVNGNFTEFSDINVYEFAVYTEKPSLLQIVVNGKNARLDGQISEESVLEDYRDWKGRNLIYNLDDDKTKALSYLISETGEFDYDPSKFPELQAASPIPIVMINANGTDLTADAFHASYDKSVTAITHNCEVQYIVNGRSVSFRALISLQGTSTLGYYIKNLEMRMNEPCSEDSSKVQLLQVKEDWFPEREYTLKADVVDSAHANNATIGYWINHECKLMEDNPAMAGFSDAWRPKDVNANGAAAVTHADTRTETLGQEIDFDEKVTIKHNLEGFPVLMLIRFAGENNYDLIGIYSFNLGRYSYYNMGMKFLKEFSRRTSSNPNGMLPAVIDHYIEYGKDEQFGDNGIKTSDIFSYEFGATADDNDENHQTWTQHRPEVLQFYGSFNFNGAASDPATKVEDTDPIWTKLSNLFLLTATMGSASGNLAPRGFGGKEQYTSDGNKLIPAGGNPYSVTETSMEGFNEHMSIRNATSYFVIATALGMIDSLGKNLTLRTWDGGEKWWTVFYDMDSALALSNEGDEGISETAFIDSFFNYEDNTNVSQLGITYHDPNSKYNAYNSKLWAIFRDTTFLYINNGRKEYYAPIWTQLRSRGGALETYSNFISLMEKQVGNCGELIYDYDYESKYIGPGANLSMLHGTRIEYVRNWLKRRIYFLDGVFEDEDANAGNFTDSPFYVNKFNATNRGHNGGTIGYIPYRIKSVSPIFIKINTGNLDGTDISFGKYYIPAYTETEIHTVEHSSQKQTSFTSSQLLTEIDGLDKIQIVSLNTNQNFNAFKVLTSFVNFNIAGTTVLDKNPIVFQTGEEKNGVFMFHGESSLETIDVSNTSFGQEVVGGTFDMHLNDYQKVKSINISHSPVSNLILPSSVLQSLNVSYSDIDSFVMSNQPILQSVDFTGCGKIQTVSITNCAGLRNLVASSIPNLHTFSVNGCQSIEEIVMEDNVGINSIQIANNNSIARVCIRRCKSDNLSISIINCPSLEEVEITECTGTNTSIKISRSPIQTLNITGVWSDNVIELPAAEYLTGMTSLTLANIPLTEGFKYGDAEIETWGDDDYVLDLSMMSGLTGADTHINNVNVKYVRVPNDPENPFDVYHATFDKCGQLTKIFGHIKVKEEALNNMVLFYINHDSAYRWTPDGFFTDYSNVVINYEELYNTNFSPAVYSLSAITNPLFVSGDAHYTNVAPFEKANLSGWFANTSCDIHDVYYLLSLCGSGTTNISGMFQNCKQVETDDINFLDINTFKKCGNVSNINNIFYGCNIGGYLFEPLLTPLLARLTEFINVLSGKYKIVNHGVCFFPSGCPIEVIDGFCPNKDDDAEPDEDTGGALADDTLLCNLANLKIIRNSFNQCTISFFGGTYDATELFKHNRNLIEITNSFGWIYGLGSIANLFGGYDNSNDYYPSALTTVARSFIFRGGYHDAVFNGDYMDSGVLFPIGNKFFRRIARTLKYVTGNAVGSNQTYNNDGGMDWIYGGMTSFSGPGICKFLSNFESIDPRYPGMDDCDGGVFPYDIFKNCVSLQECPALFEGVHNFRNYNAPEIEPGELWPPIEEEREEVVVLDPLSNNGVSIFNDCVNLQNLSCFFRNMSKSIHCTLHGGAFKNCSLVNVEKIFQNIYVDGKIPFKLFYEEGVADYSIDGLTAAQASALGITDDEGDLPSISPGEYSTHEGTYKYGKKTIKKMAYAISNISNSSSMTYYSVENNEFENTICDNSEYSPFEYVLEGLHYKRNTNKHPYTWNKYAYDGSTDFLTRLTGSTVWSRSDIDKNNLPAEFVDTPTSDINDWTTDKAKTYTGYDIVSGGSADKFKTKNYFCPPDIFNYCENTRTTDVTGVLSNICGYYDKMLDAFFGAIGRIPEFIFEEISDVASINEMFTGNRNMLPDTWGSSSSNLGSMYPAGLFSCFSGLESVSSVFSGTRAWRYTQVPEGLFQANGGSLRNVSRLWSGVVWIEPTALYPQVNGNLFSTCGLIQDVSAMFAGSQNESIVYVTPLFTYSSNRLINNCSEYLSQASRAQGSVPTFWKDWQGMNGNLAFFGIISPYSYEAMHARFSNWEENVPLNYYTEL